MNPKNPDDGRRMTDDGKHNGQRSTDNSERYFSVANNPINSINPSNSTNSTNPNNPSNHEGTRRDPKR